MLLLPACSDLLTPRSLQKPGIDNRTKSASMDYYYWYHDEKIGLTVNKEHVNIVVDTALVKRSDMPMLCSELDLEEAELIQEGMYKTRFKHAPTEDVGYRNLVEELRDDARILFVLPYFEQEGSALVGTSPFFYVQLKEITSEGTQYIMKEYDVDALEEEVERMGVRVIKEVAYMPDWYKLSIEGSIYKSALDAANHIYETGRFKETDPAFMFEFEPFATNDPLFSQQWGLNNTTYPGYDINVESAWQITTGSGVKIAVVDNKIDPNHGDLSSNLYNWSCDVSTGTSCTHTDGLSHGTHVAGIAGAVGNNNLQIAGVAYSAKIMRVRIRYSDEYPESSEDEIASGISWAWINGADVISCSWGSYAATNHHCVLLENAIINAMNNGRGDKGSVVVFALGNSGNTTVGYPGRFDSRILTVGAIQRNGMRWSDSSYGPALDVVAPGDSITSLLPYNNVGLNSGTSMAAPHVSGVAALMLAANPQLTREDAVRVIQRTAKKITPGSPGAYLYYPRDYMFPDDTWNQEVGHGLVDATAAITMGMALARIPAASDTGMDVSVFYSPTNNQHYATVSGGSFPKVVNVSLLPAQINSAYSYFWRLSTSSYPNWTPALTFADDHLASINIPSPSTSSVLYIQCFVYNGSTLVDVPSYTLYVNP